MVLLIESVKTVTPSLKSKRVQLVFWLTVAALLGGCSLLPVLQ